MDAVVEVDPARFEAMVSEALDGLPAELGELMSNVAVTVEHNAGPAGLLGLYRGVPLTRRTTAYAGVLPDRITIYRRAICAICHSEQDVVEEVRRTVIHEVAHHFGINDARLRELGW
jgi:predicted Zn-dependent protease with MMP-like domain